MGELQFQLGELQFQLGELQFQLGELQFQLGELQFAPTFLHFCVFRLGELQFAPTFNVILSIGCKIDGNVVRYNIATLLNTLEKDKSGYALAGIFVGRIAIRPYVL